ncbi:ABC transporter ATP-binding protein [Rhodobacteraceae bacterium D3-12]|nr:ABC transporter ATP-binding protein [Rhodobacteraceae bacterium D3-12]
MSAVIVENLVAGYTKGDTILKSISVTVEAGEIVAILGPNGAGKSTLLKAMAGQLKYATGRVSAAGLELLGMKPGAIAREGIAYVPQEANVFPTMTIRENLEIGGYVAKSDPNKRIEELFERFPVLHDKRRDLARTMSGGQRQLLAMAIAMMVEPKVLLLDEPSAGLSPKAAGELFTTIREIAATGVAVLLVEQNALEALDLADRAYIFAAGQNHTEGPAKELAADPSIRRTFLGGH